MRFFVASWNRSGLVFAMACVLAGCSQPTDLQKFEQALQKVQEESAESFDVRLFPDITDAEAERLATIATLRDINLDNAPISDDVVSKLVEGIPQMQSLSLTNTKVTNRCLQSLQPAAHLIRLRVDMTRITDAGLQHLQQIPTLEELHMWRTRITDQGVAYLSELPKLRYLSLDETQVTDEGLKSLEQMKSLRYLSLWKTQVTDEGVQRLQTALPALEINR